MAHQSSASILSRSRLAVLHVARKQLGLADDHYRAILLGAGGVESAAELDELGFERAMSATAQRADLTT